MKRLLILPAVLALLLVVALPASAGSGSGPPPVPWCHPAMGPGLPSTGPCTETDHFSQLAFPVAPTPGCGPQTFGFLMATGNGVQHVIVNKAGDSWFTTTFTGSAQIFAVDLSTNPPTIGPLLASGHITTWFGGEFNKQNYVLHDTTTFQGTDAVSGQSIHLHFVDHASSVPPNDLPTGDPNVFPPENAHTFFMKVVC
jgi:hypothetical protein